MLHKIVFAGVHHPSFAQARQSLQALAELDVSIKQVERWTQRIGTERCAERDAQVEAYHRMPLVERKGAPAGVEPPEVGVVMADGGRLQILDRRGDVDGADEDEEPLRTGHWREDKIGLLMSMSAEEHVADPCGEIPEHFVDPLRIVKLAREIKGSVTRSDDGVAAMPDNEDSATDALADDASYEPPRPQVRSVVATRKKIKAFGRMLSAEAYARGLYQSPRRAFVADGAEGNWTLWARHFSSFEPILDFIHALSYVFASAMAGRPFAEGWDAYVAWIGWVWQGDVDRAIAALAARHAELGEPPEDAAETHPAKVVSEALGYLRNQRQRMSYARYRRVGLPITSSHVESTIKRINQRVKGSEKFWSERGAEPILQLRADALSETKPLEAFWQRRQAGATGQRRQRRVA